MKNPQFVLATVVNLEVVLHLIDAAYDCQCKICEDHYAEI